MRWYRKPKFNGSDAEPEYKWQFTQTRPFVFLGGTAGNSTWPRLGGHTEIGEFAKREAFTIVSKASDLYARAVLL